MYYIVLYCIVLYYVIYHIILYYIISYYITLYYIILYVISFIILYIILYYTSYYFVLYIILYSIGVDSSRFARGTLVPTWSVRLQLKTQAASSSDDSLSGWFNEGFERMIAWCTMVNSGINHGATDFYHLGFVVNHTQLAQHCSWTHYISTLKELQSLQLCSPTWSGSRSRSHCNGKKLGCSSVLCVGIVRNQRKESRRTTLRQRLFGQDLQPFLLCSNMLKLLRCESNQLSKTKSAVRGCENTKIFALCKQSIRMCLDSDY